MTESETAMKCNECGGTSTLNLDTPEATDPRCSVCGSFQMKAEQVVAYGQGLANALEGVRFPSNELVRLREMVKRFFWLANRRGVAGVPNIGNVSTSSEIELRSVAQLIRSMAEAIPRAPK